MQQITINIPIRRELNDRFAPALAAKYAQAAHEIGTFFEHELCGVVHELDLVANELANQGMRIQLRGAAASSELLYQIGLSIICPNENDFLFERFLEPKPKHPVNRPLILVAYTMFPANRIAKALEDCGFHTHESSDGFTASKPDQTEGDTLLSLVVSANETGKCALPTYRQLVEFQRNIESSFTGNDLNWSGLDTRPVYQEDQMRTLSEFANVEVWEAYVLIRDIKKHGIKAEVTETQIRFIDAAERNGNARSDTFRLLVELDKSARCKSHCFCEVLESREIAWFESQFSGNLKHGDSQLWRLQLRRPGSQHPT